MRTMRDDPSRRWGALVAAALLALGLGWSPPATGAPAAGAGGERMGVEVSFGRAEEAGRYRCTTTVRDLVAGTILAEPEMVLPEQENGTLRLGGEEEGWELLVTAFVSEGGRRLDHAVVLRRGGEITASQSLTFHFDR